MDGKDVPYFDLETVALLPRIIDGIEIVQVAERGAGHRRMRGTCACERDAKRQRRETQAAPAGTRDNGFGDFRGIRHFSGVHELLSVSLTDGYGCEL